ncbi:MAG: hypothetical protein ABGY42_06450, partial [bacterium]
MRRSVAVTVALVCSATFQTRIHAQQVTPPPPLAPEVIARDGRGGTTVRATRLSEQIRLDGRLD